MSEWWTYTPSDFLLFSPRTYYRLFELHNGAIWPGQILAIAAMLWNPRPWRDRAVAALLAACWAWVAWAYLHARYATINWAAGYMAGAFAAEALLLLLIGAAGGRLPLRPETRWVARSGAGLYVFALAVQPLIGPFVGRAWSQVEVFGVAPDPTVVATLGVLLRATTRLRWALLPIPIAWCAVSGATAWAMGTPDAWVMPSAGALALVAAVFPRAAASDCGGPPRHRRPRSRRHP